MDAITGHTSFNVRLCRSRDRSGIDHFPRSVQQDLELRGFYPVMAGATDNYRRNGLEELSLEVLRDYHEQIVAADLALSAQEDEKEQAKKQARVAERPAANRMWPRCSVWPFHSHASSRVHSVAGPDSHISSNLTALASETSSTTHSDDRIHTSSSFLLKHHHHNRGPELHPSCFVRFRNTVQRRANHRIK